MRCPTDVKIEHFREMLAYAPKGCVLKSSRVVKSKFTPRFWRDFIFKVEKEPSKESGLKRGDIFTLTCVRKFPELRFP